MTKYKKKKNKNKHSPNNIRGCHEYYWSTCSFKKQAGGFELKLASDERLAMSELFHTQINRFIICCRVVTDRQKSVTVAHCPACNTISSNHLICQQAIMTVRHPTRTLRGLRFQLIFAVTSFIIFSAVMTGRRRQGSGVKLFSVNTSEREGKKAKTPSPCTASTAGG